MVGRATVGQASAILLVAMGLGGYLLSVMPASGQDNSPSHSPSSSAATSPVTPPSEGEIAERAKRLVDNQHRDDEALKEFERIERHTDLTSGPNPRTIEDKMFRI